MLKDIKYPKGYKEKENLWVRIYGTKDGKKKFVLMESIVPTLHGWETAGCNIDTGMPASILAQLVYKGLTTRTGAFSPEVGVPPKIFFKELAKRKIKILENSKRIN